LYTRSAQLYDELHHFNDYDRASSDLLRLVCDHCALFARPWAHLHRNLSGKYRITRLSDGAEIFDQYRTGSANLADGVHIQFDRPTPVELLGEGLKTSALAEPAVILNDRLPRCFHIFFSLRGEEMLERLEAHVALGRADPRP